MSNAVDLAGKLNATTAANLVKNGITHVGRYLSHTAWKGLDPVEVNAIKGAGLQIFSIYETNPTSVGYFTPDKGKSDALDGIALAQAVGQPTGTAIYFTVDYDVKTTDYPAILAYFQAVKNNLSGYMLGAYGNYAILNFLHSNNAADYYFQTCAWSGGQRNNFLNIYQYQCDKQFAGLNVDFDNLEQADVGAWGQSKPIRVIIPNLQFWQARNLVEEFEGRGFKCYGHNLKTYAPGQQPSENDPYQFIIETDYENAKYLVIELKTRQYDRTYGEEIK